MSIVDKIRSFAESGEEGGASLPEGSFSYRDAREILSLLAEFARPHDAPADVVVRMTKVEARVLLVLMEQFGDILGSNGCNDFSLLKQGTLSTEDALVFLRSVRDAGTFDYPPKDGEFDQMDFVLLGHFKALVKRAVVKGNEEKVLDALRKSGGDLYVHLSPKDER